MKKWLKRIGIMLLLGFLFLNGIVFMHAYKFTHFGDSSLEKTSSEGMTTTQKLSAALLGANVPRPMNHITPDVPFEVLELESENGKLHGWWMPMDSAKATVIVFHGYGAVKSRMIPYIKAFQEMNLNVLAMDTSGSGDSEGHSCTIGHKEAEDARVMFDYIKEKQDGKIYLFGTSMGAATILRAMSDLGVKPDKAIIECPYGSMLTATQSRFENMGIPHWGLKELLVFWGGVQNGFNSFQLSPMEYAKNIDVPILHLWGAKDKMVRKYETDAVFKNLAGEKKLVVLPNSEHADPISGEPTLWRNEVRTFLEIQYK